MGKVMPKADLDRIIQLSDKDNSGTLDYEEFIAQVFGK
jgi:Ca2+-binding EF-hand superfamily protein